MGAVGKGRIDYECEKIIGFWELKKKLVAEAMTGFGNA